MPPLPLKPQQIQPLSLHHFHSLRPSSSSSSSSSPPFPNPNEPTPTETDETESKTPTSSYSSLFSDIKQRLKSPPTPPRLMPTDPPPSSPSPPASSLEDIRKHLAEFRLKSSSPPRTLSFQELFKKNATPDSLGSIRDGLRRFRPASSQGPPKFQSPFRRSPAAPSLVGGEEKLPESIFGRELREKVEAGEALRTEFVKLYGYDELGEKLRRLRPEAAEKGGKDWFSLSELNLRLAKLRELEEKETESRMGGVSFRDLRESLVRLKEADANKRASMQRISILTNLGLQGTPAFMLKPPQEELLENYFHPDHMSSAEKMNLELKKVRDEFKMSESDCGSARVQVAQLTTKIKHLSSVLHKKDKHSRKGLHDMVQRRKKLLKYLRRTDWDSYCLVLSKLGLRDVPEYKTPDYKG